MVSLGFFTLGVKLQRNCIPGGMVSLGSFNLGVEKSRQNFPGVPQPGG